MEAAGLPRYERILLKLSGEALMGEGAFGIDPKVLDRLASDIQALLNLGVQVAVVIGGGNLFRGASLSAAGLGRITGDHMGMLATLMNALALRDALERIEIPTRVMSAIPMSGIVDHYDRRKALDHLNRDLVVIFAAGIGNPLFTTDTAACVRAIEIDADVMIKGTKVNGVYSADPQKNPQAVFYDRLSYQEVITQDLRVMDLTAICLCQDYDMPLHVFNLNKPGALMRVVAGKPEGTLIERKKLADEQPEAVEESIK